MSNSFLYIPEILTRKKVIELINSNSFTTSLVIQKTCDSGATVGDIVMYTTTNDENVDVSTTNDDIRPSIGIIIEKVDPTTAKIMIMGEFNGASGLTPGNKIFLSTTGSLTSTPPTVDYLQCMGVAISTTKFLFSPQIQRVKRI